MSLTMDLHGSLANKLHAAIASARRHQGHPVHSETIAFWSDLLQHARLLKFEGNEEAMTIDPLLAELDAAIAQRRSTWTFTR